MNTNTSTPISLSQVQEDLFMPQDQNQLDHINYLAINQLIASIEEATMSSIDPELYDVIWSVMHTETRECLPEVLLSPEDMESLREVQQAEQTWLNTQFGLDY